MHQTDASGTGDHGQDKGSCNWKNMAHQLRVLKDGIEKLDKKNWRKRRDLGKKIEDYKKGAMAWTYAGIVHCGENSFGLSFCKYIPVLKVL